MLDMSFTADLLRYIVVVWLALRTRYVSPALVGLHFGSNQHHNADTVVLCRLAACRSELIQLYALLERASVLYTLTLKGPQNCMTLWCMLQYTTCWSVERKSWLKTLTVTEKFEIWGSFQQARALRIHENTFQDCLNAFIPLISQYTPI